MHVGVAEVDRRRASRPCSLTAAASPSATRSSASSQPISCHASSPGDAADRAAQPVGVVVDVGERDALGADVPARQRVVGVAADAGDRAVGSRVSSRPQIASHRLQHAEPWLGHGDRRRIVRTVPAGGIVSAAVAAPDGRRLGAAPPVAAGRGANRREHSMGYGLGVFLLRARADPRAGRARTPSAASTSTHDRLDPGRSPGCWCIVLTADPGRTARRTTTAGRPPPRRRPPDRQRAPRATPPPAV